MGNEIAESFKFNGSEMDSREIAKITGKQHAHVCRDIEEQLGQLPGGVSRFGDTYRNEQNGQSYRCFLLPKRECMILASGYDVVLRAAIIDRWVELEAAAALMIPKSFAEALRLAANQAEELERKTAELEAARPALAFVEKFVEAKQTQPLRQVANVLKIPQNTFVAALLANGVLYREMRGGKPRGSLMPKAEHLQKGRFEVKEVLYGENKATTQMRFTAKGIEWIAEKVQEWGLAA